MLSFQIQDPNKPTTGTDEDLKGNYIGTTAVTQCVNSKPFAYSNICETAGGESRCQSLLLSYKKF